MGVQFIPWYSVAGNMANHLRALISLRLPRVRCRSPLPVDEWEEKYFHYGKIVLFRDCKNAFLAPMPAEIVNF